MSVKCIPPYTSLLYSKTGVYRGIPFCIFDPKYRLWVLVRTASAFVFNISMIYANHLMLDLIGDHRQDLPCHGSNILAHLARKYLYIQDFGHG